MSVLHALFGVLARWFLPCDERQERALRDLAHERGTTLVQERGAMFARRAAIKRYLRAELGREPTPEELVELLRAGQKRLHNRSRYAELVHASPEQRRRDVLKTFVLEIAAEKHRAAGPTEPCIPPLLADLVRLRRMDGQLLVLRIIFAILIVAAGLLAALRLFPPGLVVLVLAAAAAATASATASVRKGCARHVAEHLAPELAADGFPLEEAGSSPRPVEPTR